MAYYLTSPEEKFDILVFEGGDFTPIFKRDNIIKIIEAKEYDNLKIAIRTHTE